MYLGKDKIGKWPCQTHFVQHFPARTGPARIELGSFAPSTCVARPFFLVDLHPAASILLFPPPPAATLSTLQYHDLPGYSFMNRRYPMCTTPNCRSGRRR